MIVVTLKEYLAQLERQELALHKNKQRHVPNFSELAKATGMTFKTVSKLANNRGANLNKNTLTLIIIALREAGFPTNLSDIVSFQVKEG